MKNTYTVCFDNTLNKLNSTQLLEFYNTTNVKEFWEKFNSQTK